MMQPIKRVALDKHIAQHNFFQTTGGRWMPSLVHGAIFTAGYSLIRLTIEAGILDPGIRVHGASAATFWYKDASRRSWIMPSTEEHYSEIARTLKLEEVVDPFYGPYLRYFGENGQARVLLPDPDIEPKLLIVTHPVRDITVSVATLDELLIYYGKRQHIQKGMYAKLKRPYKRIAKS